MTPQLESFIFELGKRIDDHMQAETKRQEDAERRSRDFVAVHRDGWRQTSDAIVKGFGLVADAIRSSR